VEKLKETLNILDNINVKNEDSLEYIKEPIDDLMSKLKYLPVEPSFDILPPEMKTKILGYLSTNEALTAASVCQEWKDILLKQNPTNQQESIPPISKMQWPFKELTRFCYKRFFLDLMAGLLLCLLTVNSDEPVQLRTVIHQAGVMLLFIFYWMEERYSPVTAVIESTILVLYWPISTYLYVMYESAPVRCVANLVAILIQFLFFMALNYYDLYMWPAEEVDWSKLAFSKQSFVSIPFWAISFYLVGVYEYAPAAILIVG